MDIKVRDSNGAQLAEGDTVTLIKDLKLKGSSTVLKRGTVIKNIHLTDETPTRSRAAPTRSRVWCCARSS
jgi:alkylphosphonate utilization operon protein PhnA